MAKEREKAAAETGTGPVPRDVEETPAYPMSLDEFVRTYEPGREVEMKHGFRIYAAQEGYYAPVALTEWKTRYEAFRNRPVG